MNQAKRKFSTKEYQGRLRIYTKISGAANIQRIWVWDKDRSEYVTPPRGNVFEALRYEITSDGGRKRVRQSFSALDDARQWQNRINEESAPVVRTFGADAFISQPETHVNSLVSSAAGLLLGEVYAEYHRRKLMRLSENTRRKYEQYVRLHLQELMQMPIRSITPYTLDRWLDGARRNALNRTSNVKRTSFMHELVFLNSLLNYYVEYYEDSEFKNPMRKRHRQDAFVCKAAPKHRDLTEDEFKRFLVELGNCTRGEVYVAMATVQYYQALRISEVAAIHFEDLNLNWRNPEDSTLRVCRHMVYMRQKGCKPTLMDGFKNASGGQDSVREQPLFQQSFEALKGLFRLGSGLIFASTDGLPFTYRQIQKAFDGAFRRAGLPYSGTHVLRHGGCRRVYNATKDLAVAQMLLGNTDMDSTLVYAKRDKGAVREFAKQTWVREGGGEGR
jgi:integrase